jgi:hypothetical protein
MRSRNSHEDWQAQMPQSPELSGWHVKKTVNGGVELNPSPVGAELARDSGVSANINAGCDGLIASKLAPTGG